MAEVNSMNPRAVQIRAPPSLTTCIDIVNKATAPYHNERPMRGAIISFDFKYPSTIFFVQKESIPKFDLNFIIQIQDEYHVPIEVQAVEANHFNLDNNIAKLLNDSTKFPTVEIKSLESGTVKAQMSPPDDYGNWGDNNVRLVVLSNVYPSNIDVSVSLSATNGTRHLRSAFTGASRPYTASSPNEEKLRKLLCWTAGLGYVKFFKAYLDQVPLGLETEDTFGMTPFSWAAQIGRASAVKLALQQAGSICARRRTTRGPAPLEAAARSKDETIFISFLKWLKYLENPIVDTTSEPDEIPDVPPDLGDDDIEREIQLAVRNEQAVTIRKLVELLRNRQGEKAKQDKWLVNRMVKAAEEGGLYLVQALKFCGADVNCKDDSHVTPLMGAMNKGKTKVAEYLIFQGAMDTHNRALHTAVINRQHSTIRALLQVKKLKDGETKNELLRIAADNKDSTTLMLLYTEKLATPDDLHPKVDRLFEATVVDFSENQSPKFQELSVKDLMEKPGSFFDFTDRSEFKWFHLPANNMKWAEALIGKIYYQNPSLASKVLEQKRWIKRQHEGEKGSSHARFMMPACHDFQEAFRNKKKTEYEREDRHVVLFMPYLHWDEEAALKKRSEFLAQHSPEVSPSDKTQTPSPDTSTEILLSKAEITYKRPTLEEKSQREEMLLHKYLLSESKQNNNSRHLLHIRRTLDQSLYHNLKDTKIRDADQTVRRYQQLLNKDKQPDEIPFTVIMVDQLWLWILLGPSGKAQAVVTCFPSRDWFDVDRESNPKRLDPRRTTDVLQTTKSYIQQRPDAAKTPYDLAGVIASRCSRALLDHSTDMLDFTEVYENSISYIMNEEVLLFNTFNHLMQTRTKGMQRLQTASQPNEEDHPREADSCLANDILEEIESLGKDPKETDKPEKIVEPKKIQESKTKKGPKDRLLDYRNYTLDTEIPDEDEIEGLKKGLNRRPKKEPKKEPKKGSEKGPKKSAETEAQRLTNLFEKFGRFFVLDITREISLLRQIKDIQDELEMMEKVFADQKEVIEALDRIIRSMIRSNDPNDDKQEALSTKYNLRRSDSNLKPVGDDSESTHDFHREYKWSSTAESDVTDDAKSVVGDEHLFAYEQHGYLDKEAQKRKDFMKQAQSIIWQFRHQKQNLPIRTVNRFAEQIKKMNERARNTNKALSTLVDLKQKQNNMIDTRTARLQAEQSHTMAMEAERQGRTLMVFTVVTIVFLPLSFIAAFFAIPVQEFGNNYLTLDFVSMITFPVSAATSILIIVIGFAASEWEWIRDKLEPKVLSWLNKSSDFTDKGKQNESSIKESDGMSSHLSEMILKPNDSRV
ncbi:hypothetical protein GGI43DRAFT_404323 [Trichoderma evansii]